MNNVSTIYKRELKLLFCSLAGWIFMALNIAALGICAVWLCLKNGNPSYQYAPETATLILCFTVPLLQAMTVGAEWRRGEAPMLLRYASPLALTLGKFLAELTVFAVPAVISALLPIILLPFGVTNLTAAYVSAVTYILVGAALISIGFFVASMIKHPVIGGVVSVAVLLLLNFVSNIAKIVGDAQSFPFVIIAIVLVALVTAIMLVYLDNAVIPVVFAVVCSAVTLILALSGAAPTVLRPLLQFIAPQYAFYENIYGTVSLRGILQPILSAVVFLGFTVLNHANYNKILTFKAKKNEKEGV